MPDNTNLPWYIPPDSETPPENSLLGHSRLLSIAAENKVIKITPENRTIPARS
jgi:hypothetical protein